MNINPFIDIIVAALGIYGWIMLAWIIMSILISFDIINRHNRVVFQVSDVLYKMTEPLLRRIRRYMPNLGVIDISPIIVFLAIKFITNVLYTYFYTF